MIAAPASTAAARDPALGAEALTRLGMTSEEVAGAVRDALPAAADTAVA